MSLGEAQPDLDTSDGFGSWIGDLGKAHALRALVYSSRDQTTKLRYARMRRLGWGVLEAARRALDMLKEDREAAALSGPLRVIESKVYYFPGPGEKFMPWDLPEDS